MLPKTWNMASKIDDKLGDKLEPDSWKIDAV
jgi:hypothetical protein